MAQKKEQGPTPIKGKWFMTQSTGSLRRRLLQYPELGDEWVKEQLQRIGKGDLWFPGVAEAIKNKAVSNELSYRDNPLHEQFRNQPGQEELARRTAQKTGMPYSEQIATSRPWQEEYQQGLAKAVSEPSARVFSQIGAPLAIEPQINEILQGLAQNYQKEFGNQTGPQYFSGPGVNAYRNLPSLQDALGALGQGAQSTYQTINPYLQQAAQKGSQLAQSGLNTAQSYLAASQPYAKNAMGLGADIFNQIQGPALAAGRGTLQGLSGLLSMLRGGM